MPDIQERGGIVGVTRSEKLQKRHAIALENLYAIGQYLIMQQDCPQEVREAWRTLNVYIRGKENNQSSQSNT